MYIWNLASLCFLVCLWLFLPLFDSDFELSADGVNDDKSGNSRLGIALKPPPDLPPGESCTELCTDGS